MPAWPRSVVKVELGRSSFSSGKLTLAAAGAALLKAAPVAAVDDGGKKDPLKLRAQHSAPAGREPVWTQLKC